MSSLDADHLVDLSKLLGRTYWLIRSLPKAGTDRAAVDARVSGVTVLRTDDEESARAIAERDPFVKARPRTFEISRWLVNEGSVAVRVSLGTGRYEWT